jgi:hypothetical protein
MSEEIGKQRELHCLRCLHERQYRGQNNYFTLCPRCRTTIRVIKKESRDVVQSGQVDALIQTDITGYSDPRAHELLQALVMETKGAWDHKK